MLLCYCIGVPPKPPKPPHEPAQHSMFQHRWHNIDFPPLKTTFPPKTPKTPNRQKSLTPPKTPKNPDKKPHQKSQKSLYHFTPIDRPKIPLPILVGNTITRYFPFFYLFYIYTISKKIQVYPKKQKK